ncbi:MAG: YIP1 family protein [Bdellovibrionia bacterium]
MRDVTNSQKNEIVQKVKETALYLIHFLKNPLKEISHLPDWSWLHLILLQILLAIGSGVLSGLIPPNVYRIAAGIIIAPVVSTAMTLLLVLFLYYYLLFAENKTTSIRKLFTLVVLANTPFFVFEIGSELLPPITLVGFAITSALLIVGLVENFEVTRQRALKLVGGLLFVVFLVWLWNRYTLMSM